jgi:hypothetical protein
MVKEELLPRLKPNSQDLLPENPRTPEYFHFSKECLENQRNQKRAKVLIAEEFRNKQKLLVLKVQHL